MVKASILIVLVAVICAGLLYMLRKKFGSISPSRVGELVDALRQRSVKASVRHVRNERISTKKNKLYTVYEGIVSNMLNNLESSNTVEWFNFIIMGVAIFIAIFTFIMIKSITITAFTVIALISAGITALASIGRKKASVKLDAILDGLDLICPYVSGGITYAIEDNLDSIDPCIRDYFKDFLEARRSGMTFDRAMDRLNRALGPAFTDFANKAKIYDKEQTRGMEHIFKDIVDDNAITREINIQKNREFADMNKQFWMKTLLLVAFVTFSFFNNEGVRVFITQTTSGKAVMAVAITVVCLVYSYTQFVQLDITFGGDK